ncbi:MAG: hypothetical protein ACPG5P_02655 [Saprospiraceae bacterium]
MFDDEKIIENSYNYPCPGCGGRLAYSAEKQKVNCEYCGYTEEVDSANDMLVEHPLEEFMENAPREIVETLSKKVFDCQSCGSKFAVESDKIKVRCGFCGSDSVNLEAYDHQYIKPAGIVPFKVAQAKAESQFKKWIKRGWFHPNKLKRMAIIEDLHGIYIPFWTYDAQTYSQWHGQAGFHYYETERTYVNGKWESRQVQRTRWESRSGSLDHFFDDVLISGSHGLNQQSIQRVYPYRLEEVVNYDPKLMLGWESEIYDVEVDEGYEMADRVMDQRLRGMCSSQLGGDTQRGLKVDTEKRYKTFKHIVLPLWISSYRYRNKVYHFTVNGQTGKVAGKKPISPFKVAFVVAMVILVILAVVLIAEFGR